MLQVGACQGRKGIDTTPCLPQTAALLFMGAPNPPQQPPMVSLKAANLPEKCRRVCCSPLAAVFLHAALLRATPVS